MKNNYDSNHFKFTVDFNKQKQADRSNFVKTCNTEPATDIPFADIERGLRVTSPFKKNILKKMSKEIGREAKPTISIKVENEK